MISWYVRQCKHSSRGFNFSREKVWKHFHATFQPQLQFTSLLHQFSGQCHEFPFQNSSLFFHHNSYSPSLSSLAPVTVVSRTKYLCNFKHMNNPPRSCPQYCLFLVTLSCVFSCFQIHSITKKKGAKRMIRVFFNVAYRRNYILKSLFSWAESSEAALKLKTLLGLFTTLCLIK